MLTIVRRNPNSNPLHFDRPALRAALAANAVRVATALLGEPNHKLSNKSGERQRELRFGSRGSLCVVIAGRKAGSWYDHENGVGGGLIGLIKYRCGARDGQEAEKLAIGLLGGNWVQGCQRARDEAVEAARAAAHKQRRALELFKDASPHIATTPVELYLRGRGLSLPEGVAGRVIRFHSSCPYGSKTRHPCMLALLRDVMTNEPRAIQRTALTPSGEKIGRLTLGPKNGAAIKLTREEDVTYGLTVGEGAETTLAGMALGFQPAWALGDADGVRCFRVLSGIEALTILVDHDASGTGQRAAIECSARWTAAGREVLRVIPDEPGADINNLICEQLL
jgi:Toprim domain